MNARQSFVRKIHAAILGIPLLLSAVGLLQGGASFDPLGTVPSQPVGSLDGAFAVDGNGSATYRFTLPVPPGTAGVQPSLDIAYDHRRGDGYLGVGWALEGIPAIARCGATFPIDGFKAGVAFDSRDRFCLDGQRLIAIAGSDGADGTTYHTEGETWLSLVSHGRCGQGPCSFTARDRKGHLLSFGGTTGATGSRIPAEGRSDGAIRAWSLDRTTDLNGNSLSIQYLNEPVAGEYYPVRIDYTSNDTARLAASRAVRFEYEPRPEPVRRFLAGSRIQVTKRLAKVITQVDEQTVQSFVLQYQASGATGRSRLASLQACDAAGVCLPATRFAWHTAEPGFHPAKTSLPGPLYLIVGDRTYPAGVLQDFNGDGIADYARATHFPAAGPADLTIWLGRSDGSFGKAPFLLPGPLFRATSATVVAVALLQDINGDGLLDYSPALRNEDNGQTDLSIQLGTGSGFTLAPGYTLPGPVFWQIDGRTLRTGVLADLDADGIPDYSRATVLTASGEKLLDIHKGTGKGFVHTGSSLPGPLFEVSSQSSREAGILRDVNGDGVPDYSRATVNADAGTKDLRVHLGATPGFHFTPAFELPGQMLWVVNGRTVHSGVLIDINGDGIPDYSRATSLPAIGQSFLDVRFGTGSGYVPAGFSVPGPVHVIWPERADIQGVISDLNGDGTLRYSRATRFEDGSQDLAVHRGGGAGFSKTGAVLPGPLFRAFSQQSLGLAIYQDVNGDGVTDYVRSVCTLLGGGSLKDCDLGVHLARGPFSDLLASVTNGFQGVLAVDYAPLTSPIYTRGAATAWPIREAQSSTYAVRRFTREDGRGGRSTVSYSYSGARMDVLGRGWLGFSSITATEEEVGRRSVQLYEMRAPFYGLTKRTEKRAGDGTLLDSTDFTFLDVAPPEHQARGIHHPVRASSEAVRYQGGQAAYRVRQEFAYDRYGNLLLQSHLGDAATGVADLYECVRYRNDPAANRLGYPLQRKSARTREGCAVFLAVPGEDGVTWNPDTDLRWSRIGYDERMNIVREEDWDDSHSRFRTLAYKVDPVGNTVAATDAAGNTTEVAYETTYRSFVSRVTSAPLHRDDGTAYRLVSLREHEPRFGRLVRTTDPNGNVLRQEIDGFGRPVSLWGPDPQGVSKRLATTLWRSGDGRFFRETRRRPGWDMDAPESWPWERDLYDGLGRRYRTESQALRAGQPATRITETRFDAAGRVRQQTAPYYDGEAPPFTTIDYDAWDRPVLSVDPGKVEERTDYAQGGLKVVRTRAWGTPEATSETTFFDVLGRVRRTASPNGLVREQTWDPLSRLLRQSSAPDPRTAELSYDSLDRLRRAVRTATGTTTWDYDAAGSLRAVTDAAGNRVSFPRYDALGRARERVTRQDGETVTLRFAYDEPGHWNGLGNLTTVSGDQAPLGAWSMSYGYDAYGQEAAGTVTLAGDSFRYSRTWDPAGRLAKLTDPDGAETFYIYGADGLLSRIDGREPGEAAVHTYATFANHTALGDAQDTVYENGVRIERRFHPATEGLGRLLSLHVLSGRQGDATLAALAYRWNGLGDLTAIEDRLEPAASQKFGYQDQPLNQGMQYLTSAHGAYGRPTFEYDRLGNVTRQDGPPYEYEPGTDRLIQGPEGVVSGFAANGTLSKRVAGGAVIRFHFDALGDLVRLDHEKEGASRTERSLYTHTGRLLFRQAADGSKVYQVTETYEVADLGNGRLQHTRTVAGPHGPVVAVTSPGRGTEGAAPPGVGRAAGLTLIGVATLSTLLASLRTALRRRRSPRPLRVAVAPLVVLCLLLTTGAPALADLTPGPNGPGVPAAGRLFFVQDHRLSTCSVTDDRGVETAHLSYLPYGAIDQPRSHGRDDFRPKLVGKEWHPAAGMYDFGARSYDPVTGRFIAPDPEEQFLSPYLYGGSNPLSRVDPDGRLALEIASFLFFTALGAYFGAVAMNDGAYNPLSWDWKDEKTLVGLLVGAGIGAVGAAAGNAFTQVGIAVGSLGGNVATLAGAALNIGGNALANAAQSAAFATLGERSQEERINETTKAFLGGGLSAVHTVFGLGFKAFAWGTGFLSVQKAEERGSILAPAMGGAPAQEPGRSVDSSPRMREEAFRETAPELRAWAAAPPEETGPAGPETMQRWLRSELHLRLEAAAGRRSLRGEVRPWEIFSADSGWAFRRTGW